MAAKLEIAQRTFLAKNCLGYSENLGVGNFVSLWTTNLKSALANISV